MDVAPTRPRCPLVEPAARFQTEPFQRNARTPLLVPPTIHAGFLLRVTTSNGEEMKALSGIGISRQPATQLPADAGMAARVGPGVPSTAPMLASPSAAAARATRHPGGDPGSMKTRRLEDGAAAWVRDPMQLGSPCGEVHRVTAVRTVARLTDLAADTTISRAWPGSSRGPCPGTQRAPRCRAGRTRGAAR